MRYIGNAPLFVFDPIQDKVITKDEYRESDYHRKLTTNRAMMADWHCEMCGIACPSGDFHHLHYDTYGFQENVFIDGLYLCRECHEKIHQLDREENDIKHRYPQYDYNQACNDMEIYHFIKEYEPLEIVNGGNLNLCDRNEIKKHFSHSTQKIIKHFAKLKWQEIDNMVISGSAHHLGWLALPEIIGVSQSNIKTYRNNLYGKQTNWIDIKIQLGGNYMKTIDLSNVRESGTSNRIPAGGYICKYTNVEDREEKEYLYMEFDVVEGEFAGYYNDLNESRGFWGGKCFRSYKEKALPMFKRMCSAVNKSNPGFVFDGGAQNSNEKTLVGKKVGIILGEEEYESNDGTVRTRTYVYSECSVDDIKKGNFKIPKKKCLPKVEATSMPSVADFLDIPTGESDGVPWS